MVAQNKMFLCHECDWMANAPVAVETVATAVIHTALQNNPRQFKIAMARRDRYATGLCRILVNRVPAFGVLRSDGERRAHLTIGDQHDDPVAHGKGDILHTRQWLSHMRLL